MIGSWKTVAQIKRYQHRLPAMRQPIVTYRPPRYSTQHRIGKFNASKNTLLNSLLQNLQLSDRVIYMAPLTFPCLSPPIEGLIVPPRSFRDTPDVVT
jgi:hypothetical protein